ncbi:TetR/AcrR family transcriptional regulator [Microbacterium sp. ARD31]|uniref:TetR/AcrR family transcriptional regulator n=1 Tax=Microbacterium sp. ARD31 TaxID=2962576 RepID=UPI002882BF11|nr:TetR/AcrR family transcriptional regulator [Microbacterium sp. ARD31]MDT0184841.1 TetR/AcrR family transcriptional regulator [Microbacterium sp. ARD31]
MASGRVGAPRSESSRKAILRAAASLIEEKGFDAVTIEGIAARANVGKQTIYRWYATKTAVVAECLMEGLLIVDEFHLPETGDVRSDLRTWMVGVYSFLSQGSNVHLLNSLLSAATHDPAVTNGIGERLGAAGPAILDRLEQSKLKGELPTDFPSDAFLHALFGSIVARALTGAPFTTSDAVSTVDLLLGR